MQFRFFRSLLITALVFSLTIVAGPPPATSRSVPIGGATLDDSLPAPAIYAAFGSLDVIDPSTGEIEALGPPLPFGVAAMLANPAHARIYLFERSGSRIAVVDTRTLQVLASITVPQGLDEVLGAGWLAISSSGNRIYVVDLARDGIDVISTQSNSVAKFVPMGGLVSGVTIGDFGNRVYVSLPDQNRVVVLNASTDAVIGSFLVGQCPKRGGLEKCNITGLVTSADGRYVLGTSPRTGSVVGIDTTDNAVVGHTGVVFFACPYDAFIGVNAAANQAAIFTEGCGREATQFVSATPPFGLVYYDFPLSKFAGAFTVAFDPTGTIGYAAGDTRFDHGDLVQFTSQSNRFIDIGSPSALVLAP